MRQSLPKKVCQSKKRMADGEKGGRRRAFPARRRPPWLFRQLCPAAKGQGFCGRRVRLIREKGGPFARDVPHKRAALVPAGTALPCSVHRSLTVGSTSA